MGHIAREFKEQEIPATSATCRDTSPGTASRTREGWCWPVSLVLPVRQAGPISRDCSKSERDDCQCNNCDTCHQADCPEAGGNDAVADVCYRCNERGHIARNFRSTRSKNRC
ncbi:hypothetical protein HPB51_000489 [Rhipicephalus microplus]|uniref:CCHC-type domain-containing protein n=1 Tax=Rhipicephalus microplus TaxID=6941 RepID=A0A9J6EJK1_RHIMP|nr:hypothetical protein HPB51_000489 [Rhipicephalus microplus]